MLKKVDAPQYAQDIASAAPAVPNRWIALVVWGLPACRAKCWMLRRLGYRIGHDVTIGPTLVVSCGRFDVADGVRIGIGNIFRRTNRVEIGARSAIGNLNFISASPEYQAFDARAGVLCMGTESAMTNRHYLDCSGIIELRSRSMLAGIRSTLQSHEIDIVTNRTTVGTIVIGANTFVGTTCLLLKNARIPENSCVAAGSVVLATRPDEHLAPGLYAGAPARWKSELPQCAWWSRTSIHTIPQSADDFDAQLDLDADLDGDDHGRPPAPQ